MYSPRSMYFVNIVRKIMFLLQARARFFEAAYYIRLLFRRIEKVQIDFIYSYTCAAKRLSSVTKINIHLYILNMYIKTLFNMLINWTY